MNVHYWENLEVAVRDLQNTERELDGKIVKKLANKLGTSAVWETVLQKITRKNNKLEVLLKELYERQRDTFFDIYSASQFADRIKDASLIKSKAKAVLGETSEFIELCKDDFKPLAYVLFSKNQDALIDIYYDDLYGQSNMKTYYSKKKKPEKWDVDGKKIARILTDYEDTRKKNVRRKSKIWWVNKGDNQLKIFFRREKKGSTVVKRVNHNEFVKTADYKIFVFFDGGAKLELYTRREPARTIQIANFMASSIMEGEVSYQEKTMEFEAQRFIGFINDVKKEENSAVQILEIRVKNVPISGRPFIDIRSSNDQPINKTISELETAYHIALANDMGNIKSAKIRIKNKDFNLSFKPSSGKIRIVCNNKGYGEKEKKLVDDYFNSLTQ